MSRFFQEWKLQNTFDISCQLINAIQISCFTEFIFVVVISFECNNSFSTKNHKWSWIMELSLRLWWRSLSAFLVIERTNFNPKSMAIEFFTLCISVRLSDRSLCYTEQNKFHQKFFPVGFELTTSWSSVSCSINCAKSLFGCLCKSLWPLWSCALLIPEINKVQHVKWCMKQKKAHSNKFLPSTVSRALDWWSGGHGFKPHWGAIFWWNLFYAV